jgi:Calcium-dependent channel, 7TM region, putative phosphate/Cytosolic domain of 10TM putative phosphate transporter/Late exocytosis, associated with Golgi transport
MFLRYLRTVLVIVGPSALIITPALISLNAVRGGRVNTGVNGLDLLGWSNVQSDDAVRLWGHIICAAAMAAYILVVISYELRYFLRLRHDRSSSSQSHFVRVADIPSDCLQEDKLRGLFDKPKAILIARDLRALAQAQARQRKVRDQLEIAITRWIRKVQSSPASAANLRQTIRTPLAPWLPSLPWIGSRKDKIEYLLNQLQQITASFVADQKEVKARFPPQSSALLQFDHKRSAELIAHSVFYTSTVPRLLRSRFENIIFDNLGITSYEEQIRYVVSTLLCMAATASWAFPVALTGILSQVTYLSHLPSVSRVLAVVPRWVLGPIQGVIPQILASLLMTLFPYVLRLIVNLNRLPTAVEVELRMQNLYFVFLFIHLFLTVSISAGLTTLVALLVDSTRSVPLILAQNLPKASNYFLSYILTQSFLFATIVLLQLGAFFRLLRSQFFVQTPRRVVYNDRPRTQWGIVYPVYTNLACIGKQDWLNIYFETC